MAEVAEDPRLEQLKNERSRLNESFSEALKLLNKEIERIETGFESDKFIELHQNPAKVEFRVRLPVKEYPQANFVGRLVGPSGATIKDLQLTSGCRIAVFGRGSIKDKTKEEELRRQGGKYAHLNQDLHVHLYATGNAVSCYKRVAMAMELIEPLLAPDYREDGHIPRTPGDAFGVSPRGRAGMPMMPHRGGAMAGWPVPPPMRGMPPGVRGRGQPPVRGLALPRAAPRGRAGAAMARGNPRGRGAAGAAGRGAAAGGGRGAAAAGGRGAAGRGQPRPHAVPPPAVPVADYAAGDAYEYEASAYAADSYADPNAYGSADPSEYYDYAENQSYDAYGWGEESIETSNYGKVASGRPAANYRAHPY